MSSPRSSSPSKRWQTTTQSALADVAARIGDGSAREDKVADLRARKIANTKTSILFGNDSISYNSNAKEQQLSVQKGYNSADRDAQLVRNKVMKAQLTRANFSLGDEKTDYETTMQKGTRLDDLHSPRSGNQAAIITPKQVSSITFGAETPNYESTAHSAMRYQGNTNDFSSMKEEVTALKTHLRKHNFSLGDEKIDYHSDYQRGFPAVDVANYKQGNKKADLKKVIEDTRKCHFVLGTDEPEYLSNAHRSQQVPDADPKEVFRQMENAKKMKQALQKTSIVVGFDEEYM